MTTSNVFCFIPAKRASTRLKEKNILKINGIELLGHVVTAVKQSLLFDKIVVSSEDDYVLAIGKKYGADVLFKRPEELALDPFGVVDVLMYFLENENVFLNYEDICIALPTAPLVTPRDFQECYDYYKRSGFDCVMSVTEDDHSAYRSLTLTASGNFEYLFPEHFPKKSQELEKTYRINGAICFINTKVFLQYRDYIVPNMGGYVMPRSRSIDIDTEHDYLFAKFLMESKLT
jgi:CMP-N-acetylneuraminic acid synthetase